MDTSFTLIFSIPHPFLCVATDRHHVGCCTEAASNYHHPGCCAEESEGHPQARLQGGTAGTVSRVTVACSILYSEHKNTTNGQRISLLPVSCIYLRRDCSLYPTKTRTEDHVGGCLYLHCCCLVPTFAHASTGSLPRATCVRASLPQFFLCILPVAPSASPYIGIHW